MYFLNILEGAGVISALYVEVNLICIAVLALVMLRARQGMAQRRSRRLFSGVLLANMAFFALDAVWALQEHQVISHTPQDYLLVNCLYYMVSGTAGYAWFLYAETAQNSKTEMNWRKAALYALPMAALAVLSILSIRTGWLFGVDGQGHYQRGPWYVLQPVLSFIYPMDTAIRALARGLRTPLYDQRVKSLTLSSFALPALVCLAIQALLPPGLPLSCVGITLSLLYIFMSLQDQMISLDPLTQLNNRHQLMRYLSSRLAQESRRKPLYLMMIDVDHFKQINDRYGHLAGDHALCLVADGLRAANRGKNSFVCRYGGDEFIMVLEAEDDQEVEAMCDQLRLAVARQGREMPYTLSLTIGYARHGANAVIARELISQADGDLYRKRRARSQSA